MPVCYETSSAMLDITIKTTNFAKCFNAMQYFAHIKSEYLQINVNMSTYLQISVLNSVCYQQEPKHSLGICIMSREQVFLVPIFSKIAGKV